MLIVYTKGVLTEVPQDLINFITGTSINIIKNSKEKCDFVIFDPDSNVGGFEDEGRTYRFPMVQTRLKKKVYAKLDIFPTIEDLSEFTGFKVDTKRLLTIMLAEEY